MMRLAILVAVLLGSLTPAWAQSTATLQGTVTDTQNAVMPGVSVTIRNQATGIERAAVTDAGGQYVAASLPPGQYQVLAHIAGFQDQTREGELGVAQTVVVNIMLNGINLNDLSNSQITFQPSINTVSEFKVDNSTFSAEYGRNSGAIVNVATRSGANALHGEAFDYYRDDKFDSRNYFNPEPADKSPFNRKQFGVNLGGPIAKNRTFYFFSYEGLRHLQGVDLNSGVLTDAQRAAGTDPMSKRLLPYIPLPHTTGASGEGRLLSSGIAPVTINQSTIDLRHSMGKSDNLHGYYAFQADKRQEPNAQGNTVPDFGDTRVGHRQVMTVNETHIFSQALVNEARFGFNRLNITFDPNRVVNPADLGISNGVNFPIALPQITIQGLNLNFGGPAGFPNGRTVTTIAGGDTATYLRGNHIIKFGGQFRRAAHASFNLDPGTFTYSSVAAVPARV